MKVQRLEKLDYLHWAETRWAEYASASIKMAGGERLRLVFSVSLTGAFRVCLGPDELYQGSSFLDAAKEFNDAAGV